MNWMQTHPTHYPTDLTDEEWEYIKSLVPAPKSGKAKRANNLPFEKKVNVIAMLLEGSSIRAIERITGINRNTIMGSIKPRLCGLVRVLPGCRISQAHRLDFWNSLALAWDISSGRWNG